ncbi:MAG TPA: malto-oligosyltrehalose trehalohydrolase [Polyangia bacterium]|nr:malto-oligosyltrehalose trehalohydrolase [Polyangia bacterium]
MTSPAPIWKRRLPIGVELIPPRTLPLTEGGAHIRVWAPRRTTVEMVIEGAPRPIRLEPEQSARGYFSGLVPSLRAGTRYRLRLDNEPTLYPDPASRFQPEGPHGPSEVVDPYSYPWSDADRAWRGAELRGQVFYELHIGTFTPEGTWQAATERLGDLVDLGVTALEVLPVAEFPGRFGWGYDGVDLYAPYHLYGTPDDMRRFVDRAHGLGLAVLLDVVYNHLGPDGNYLGAFSPSYTTSRYANEWGDALNFDGPDAGPVREFFVANAGYWVEEFHLDGLRLDATQSIHDASPEHVLQAITRRVRQAAGERRTLVIGENEPQDVRLLKPPEAGGPGLEALWNDDFHHSARVAATGLIEAYYTDYRGRPQEFVSIAKRGYLFQGQRYQWQKKGRGTPTYGIAPLHFVHYLQNHDQVANTGTGERLHTITSPARHRALTALLLLGPHTPLLFQGQEFSASSPWSYFADHNSELAPLVKKGRGEFVAQFPSVATPEVQERLPAPEDQAVFERCKLDLGERERHAAAYALHKDLLRLRREDPTFAAQGAWGLDGAVLGEAAFVLRFFGEGGAGDAGGHQPLETMGRGDRLLILNLGPCLHLWPAPEPLLAPPTGRRWRPLWSSEHPRYGGRGTPQPDTDEGWRLPAESALVLCPDSEEEA